MHIHSDGETSIGSRPLWGRVCMRISPARASSILVPVLGMLLAACQTAPSAPDTATPSAPLTEQTPASGQTARRIATITGYGESTVVDVPAAAHVGEPVTIGVTTYGGGCITEDTTTAIIASRRADVTPYQLVYTPRPGEGCTLDLRINRRTVRVTFATAGAAQVVVTGRAQPGDSLVRVVRAITVR